MDSSHRIGQATELATVEDGEWSHGCSRNPITIDERYQNPSASYHEAMYPKRGYGEASERLY